MEIYVVQPGDTIMKIADQYGVPVVRLIQDNGLTNPVILVPGETIVIVHPEDTYTVQSGDTLKNIADMYGIPLMQLIRNNPSIFGRESLIPGETLVIRYNTNGKIQTMGYALPFINKTTLRKTLPYLSYLSIYNYTAARFGKITTYYDDTELIETCKQFGVAPLMLITTLSITGQSDLETAYELLLSDEYQEVQLNNVLTILKAKGYYGVSITFKYLSTINQSLYINFLQKASTRLKEEGFPLFLTVDPNIVYSESKVEFERIDYSQYSPYINSIIFVSYAWGTNFNPPSPITSITNMNLFLKYAMTMIPSPKTIVGVPTIAYDWELPYVPNFSQARSMTTNAALTLAHNENAVIQFDEVSRTPYFEYTFITNESSIKHIVWFLDARTYESLINLVKEFNLQGTGLWNIMEFNTQLWLIINSTFEIDQFYVDEQIS